MKHKIHNTDYKQYQYKHVPTDKSYYFATREALFKHMFAHMFNTYDFRAYEFGWVYNKLVQNEYIISHTSAELPWNVYWSYRRSKKRGPNRTHEKYGTYRAMRTKQERTQWYDAISQTDQLFEDYGVRATLTRNAGNHNLPTAWDDFHWKYENNWKSTTKLKKQWMKRST